MRVMLSQSGMGETPKNRVKAVAQQQRGGSRSNRRRKRRRGEEQEGIRAPLYNRDQYDPISVFKLYFCFSSCIVLILDPCSFSDLTC